MKQIPHINKIIGICACIGGLILLILTITVSLAYNGIKHLLPGIGVFIGILAFLVVIAGVFIILARHHLRSNKLHKIKTPISAVFFILMFIGLTGGYGYLFFTMVNVVPSASYAYKFDTPPFLTWNDDPTTSVSITWTSEEKTTTKLFVDTDFSHPEDWDLVGSSKKVRYHNIDLEGLTPDTKYYYRLENSAFDEELYSFTTAPVDGSRNPFKFAIFGDSQNGGGSYEGVYKQATDAALLKAEETGTDYDFLIHVGDFVDQGNDLKSWNFSLTQGSRIASNCSYQICAGNHDVGDKFMDEDAGFPYPDQGANFRYLLDYNYQSTFAPLENMNPRYYSYQYDNAYFLAIDSECQGDFDWNTPQFEWIESELSKAASDPTIDWIFCYLHRPVFSQHEGGNGGWEYSDEKNDHYEFLCPMFDKYGVDAVFQGHVHDYQAYEWELNNSVPFYDSELHPWVDYWDQSWEHHTTHYFVTGGSANDYNQGSAYSKNSIYYRGGQWTDHYMTVEVSGNTCNISAWYLDNSLIQGNQTFLLTK